MALSQTFRLKLCWRWEAACSMPRKSGIDDACGISAHHMLLSNCVVSRRLGNIAAAQNTPPPRASTKCPGTWSRDSDQTPLRAA